MTLAYKERCGLLFVPVLSLALQSCFSEGKAADRVELSSLVNQFAPAISDKPPEELGKAISLVAGLETGSQLSFQQSTRSLSDVEHFHYEQLFQGVPVWGERVTVSRNKSNEIVRYSGAVMRGLSFDVADTKPAISGQAALERARNAVRQGANIVASDFKPENENVRLVVYVRPSDKKAFLSYEVSFYAVTDKSTGKATRPFFLIDAKSGDVLYRYEGLTNEDGTGPGGNVRTGKYFYGSGNLPSLQVESSGTACRMETKDVVTINFNNQTSAPDIAYEFRCRENTFKESNGAYAPMNDAHYFASVAVNMYRQWFGTDPIKGKIILRIHYGQDFQNAFWNGIYLTFGDGGTVLYPLVSLDILTHELSHGFTEQHSGLIYTGQSGAINEAFSDMAGEAAKSFVRGGSPSDFLVGSAIVKGTGDASLRYMCDPSRDGRSISNAGDFKDGVDVHLASGVYNKAFCVLARTPGWDVRKAFGIFLSANRDYWSPNTDFVSGAKAVAFSALNAGYAVQDVAAAFKAVGIELEETPPTSGTSSQASSRTADALSHDQSSQAPGSAKTGVRTAQAQTGQVHTAEAQTAQAKDDKGMVGEWLIPETGDVLSIKEGGQWYHSKYGGARIREANDDADFKVYYTNGSTRCSYRFSSSDSGKTLILIAADPTQDPDLCPAGSLQSLHRQH